jgi:hypothetical protein
MLLEAVGCQRLLVYSLLLSKKSCSFHQGHLLPLAIASLLILISCSSIALVGAFGNMGNFSGLISGFLIESLGSHLSLFLASACVWVGLFSIWLIVVGIIPYSLSGLCCSIYIAQFGGSLTSQTSSSTSLSIFPPRYQFKIASLAKGYSGISGAIIPALAGAYFEAVPPSLFILFSSLFIPISIFAGTFVVKDIPPQRSAHFKDPFPLISQHITPYYYHFLLLLLLSIFTALLPRLSIPYLPTISKICGALLVLWLGLIFIVPQYLFACQFHSTCQAFLRKCERNCSWLGTTTTAIVCSCCCDSGREKYSSVPDSTHSTTLTGQDQVAVTPMVELKSVEEGEGEGEGRLLEPTEDDSPMPIVSQSSEPSPVNHQSKYPDYTVRSPLSPLTHSLTHSLTPLLPPAPSNDSNL